MSIIDVEEVRSEVIQVCVTPAVYTRLLELQDKRRPDTNGGRTRPSLSGAAGDVLQYFFSSDLRKFEKEIFNLVSAA